MPNSLRWTAAASLIVGILVAPGAALAVPNGSYLETCRNVRQSGSVVSADCLDRIGVRSRTTIDMNSCSSDRLSNLDGELRCEGGLPPGSYRQSCNDTVVQSNVLSARCRDRGGRMRTTSLSLPCRGSISNNDGQLICIR
jgi:hypothetical protein